MRFNALWLYHRYEMHAHIMYVSVNNIIHALQLVGRSSQKKIKLFTFGFIFNHAQRGKYEYNNKYLHLNEQVYNVNKTILISALNCV